MAGIIQKTNTTINRDANGDVTSEETTIDSSVIHRSDEGDFIKIYFTELDKLPDILTMSSFRFLIQLSAYATYADVNDLEGGMIVQVTALVREEIQSKLNIKKRTFYDNLKNLITCNLIREVRKSCYQLNPMLLGKGYYEYKANYMQGGIKDLREYWKDGCKQRVVTIGDNRYLLYQLLDEVKKLTKELNKAEKTKDYKLREEIQPQLVEYLKALRELSTSEYTKYVKYTNKNEEEIKKYKEEEEEKKRQEEQEEIQEELEEPTQTYDDDFTWFERNLDVSELEDCLYS